ncbi:spore cortex-lytic enzyme [Bacillus sp. OK048]|uniref:spore cortex-lytic enzyme n=1 Tax=Bacillus sp. OK048 TaxID=1882761 RepID=UPI0008912413|nr:spore cortex-lytic enzyme [Bacillus sp. OK048]SDM46177.1 N-acetylmuramoyl-L-alanine amidase [Bacillus sp. OK048]
MKKKIVKITFPILLSLCITPFTFMEDNRAFAFSNQVIQQGAVGDDVIELQSRLQYLGFYNKKIDGVFGWSTYWALRNFQYEFGLSIDGLAGNETKAKLVKASKYDKQFVKEQINKGNKFTHYGGVEKKKQTAPAPKAPSNTAKPKPGAPAPAAPAPAAPKATPQKPTAANTPGGFSSNDIQLMANAVYGEARGEPYTGQVAVAAVILNRVNSASFPNTVSGVIFEPGAFTAVADGQIWLTPNEQAKKAVLDAINGIDPTGEALYYFNPVTATSKWIWSRPQIKRIGKHIFCE